MAWLQLAFSPHDRQLYALGSDHRVSIWEPSSHRFIGVMGQTSDWIEVLALSNDGELLAVGSSDGFIAISKIADWNPNKDEGYSDEDRGITFISGFLAPVRTLAFSLDGMTLASGDDSGLLEIWNVATGDRLTRVRDTYGTVGCVAYSPTGEVLVSASRVHRRNTQPTGVLKIRHASSADLIRDDTRFTCRGLGFPSHRTIACCSILVTYNPDDGS